MRKGLVGLTHQYKWATDTGKFFQEIDRLGGWPVGFAYVGFEHTDERVAGFTNSSRNDGWWTVVASADDYYLWKLSAKAKAAFASEIYNRIKLAPFDLSKLFLPNSHWPGHITPSDAQGEDK